VALISIITSEQWQIKHLDKVFWIIIVILLPLIGSILWFAVGRDWAQPVSSTSFGDPRRPENRTEPGTTEPSTTERELAALEREIVAHQNADRIRRLEAEVEAKLRAKGERSP
jgi:hypothetical protein